MPKEVVKWLGIYFDKGLTFKQHASIRTSQTHSAFQKMARLVNSERGLSPFTARQLYTAYTTSIADYGSTLWWRDQAQLRKPLQGPQNLALRNILGIFKTTHTIPMKVEAGLPPPRSDSVTASASTKSASSNPFQPTQSTKILRGLSKEPLPAVPTPSN